MIKLTYYRYYEPRTEEFSTIKEAVEFADSLLEWENGFPYKIEEDEKVIWQFTIIDEQIEFMGRWLDD